MSNDDIQVRIAKKLANIIQTAKPNARVHHYWILGQGPLGESFPDMLSDTETEWGPNYIPWPHAYVIGYDAFPRELSAISSYKDSTQFRLWGFYGFMKGDATKNSSDIASVHFKQVQNALTAATKLQTASPPVPDPNGVPEVVRHYEWDITETGIYWMNEHKVHIAQGEIVVEARLRINPTPIT